MKKNTFKILILLVLSAFCLSSCSSDDAAESNGTTTGDYFPMAVNNKWQYTNGTDATEMNLIGTTAFGGNTYYEFTDTSSETNVQAWMNKRGASYYQKSAPYTETQGSLTITIAGFEIKIFQDDLQVGETWTGSAKPKVTYTGSSSGSTSANISYVGNITARDVSVTLGGITYNNVIKMQMTLTETVNSQTVTISGENWFAKDIGLIYDSTTISTDNITKTRYLTSYTLH
ncbi:hypothetical protein QWY90_14330 [Flavobacterium paronense]|uniref:Uncharacterized protein n=1 Tax=Flavobacterium paronense TaxID=1392775 RepID=A0ABV5GEV8_9FLAO|nr:hypothetical protein [Flavobacterium paronense]MDN3678488.1 hypothetical protein [Flavobacterium paronense]